MGLSSLKKKKKGGGKMGGGKPVIGWTADGQEAPLPRVSERGGVAERRGGLLEKGQRGGA